MCLVTLCDAMDCSPPGSSVHWNFWSGLPFPTPGNLCNPEMEPVFPVSLALAGGFFTMAPQNNAIYDVFELCSGKLFIIKRNV